MFFKKRGRDDDDGEEFIEDLTHFTNQLEKHTAFHTKKILEEDVESVESFLNEITRLILEQINQIEDDDIALDLTTLVTTSLGGIGTALIQLKEQNDHYQKKVIDYIAKNQNPESN